MRLHDLSQILFKTRYTELVCAAATSVPVFVPMPDSHLARETALVDSLRNALVHSGHTDIVRSLLEPFLRHVSGNERVRTCAYCVLRVSGTLLLIIYWKTLPTAFLIQLFREREPGEGKATILIMIAGEIRVRLYY
jgi:hypothetical protein